MALKTRLSHARPPCSSAPPRLRLALLANDHPANPAEPAPGAANCRLAHPTVAQLPMQFRNNRFDLGCAGLRSRRPPAHSSPRPALVLARLSSTVPRTEAEVILRPTICSPPFFHPVITAYIRIHRPRQLLHFLQSSPCILLRIVELAREIDREEVSRVTGNNRHHGCEDTPQAKLRAFAPFTPLVRSREVQPGADLHLQRCASEQGRRGPGGTDSDARPAAFSTASRIQHIHNQEAGLPGLVLFPQSGVDSLEQGIDEDCEYIEAI